MKLTRLEWVLGVAMSIAVVEGGLPAAFAADAQSIREDGGEGPHGRRPEGEEGDVAREEREARPRQGRVVSDGEGDMGKGAEFDAHFAKMMLVDHKKDIPEVTAARDNTKDESLKELLTVILPTLKKHQAEAEKIVDMTKK
jgi:hypothetical protein